MYDIMPTLEHYTCMIDLYCRTGHLENAVSVLKDMPFSADRTLWHALMGASQKWGNMKVGRLAFDNLMRLNKDDAVAYISMCNIYVTSGMEEDADMIWAITSSYDTYKDNMSDPNNADMSIPPYRLS